MVKPAVTAFFASAMYTATKFMVISESSLKKILMIKIHESVKTSVNFYRLVLPVHTRIPAKHNNDNNSVNL